MPEFRPLLGQLIVALALATGGCNQADPAVNGTGGAFGGGGASVTGGAASSGQPSSGEQTGAGGQTATGGIQSAGGAAGTGGASAGGTGTGGSGAGGSVAGATATATGGNPGTGGRTVGTGGATGTGGAMATGGAGGATADAAIRDSAGDVPASTNDTNQGRDTAVSPAGDAKVDASTLPAVTLWLAGDSTCAAYGSTSAQQGWGEHLAEFFNSKVTIQNKAVGGRTVTSFDWSFIGTGVKAGDYVMIEFGINDSSAGSTRYVAPADFQAALATEVDAILSKKAIPIMVTPSALQGWQSNGTNSNTREQPYCDAMKAVAAAKGILVDDLNARSLENLNKIGQTAAAAIYYNGDKAHFTLMGATLMAQYVTQELVHIGSPLGSYVN